MYQVGAGKIVAQQIDVKNLSAMSSKLGEIQGDTADYKLVMGSGGSAEEGTFLLGATDDESYLRRWKENGIWKMALKLASFIVDAVSSKVLGKFEVKNSAGTATHLTVDNTTGATYAKTLQIGNGVGQEVLKLYNADTPSNMASRIEFRLTDGQDVQIRHNSHDSVRAPFGLHIERTVDNTTPPDRKAYLDVEGKIYSEGGTVWHSGNDGSGSGLDADTVRGLGLASGGEGGTSNNTLLCTVKGVTDANNITGNGVAFTTTETPINFPEAGYHVGLQFYIAFNKDYKIQLAFNNNNANWYTRKQHNGGWGNWNLLWTSTNDGSGSGLDADLLDGQHGSYYAPVNNPTFTGTPTAPTPATETNNTQIATTAFVKNQKYEPNRGTGTASVALGANSTASGNYSTALGRNAKASGYNSTALGESSEASGDRGIALGTSSEASGDFSTALGRWATASGANSIALGNDAVAPRDYQITIGTKFVYLRFPSNTTEAWVHTALSPFVNPTVGISQGAMGSFGGTEVSRLHRTSSSTIALYSNTNTSIKTIRDWSGDSIGSDLAICTVKY